MKKGYVAYLFVMVVLCGVALLVLQPSVARLESGMARADRAVANLEKATVPLAPKPAPTEAIAEGDSLPFPDPPPGYVPPKPEPSPKPVVKPKPKGPEPGHAYTPSCSSQLVPLQGWVDQPNKDKPGHVHTELMVANVPVAHPCLEKGTVYRLPYGVVVVGGRRPER